MTNPKEKYRPSNGSEGRYFMSIFCENCKKDENHDCPIIVESMVNDLEDPDYPSEWCYDDKGKPTCTAFEENKNDKP